MVGSGCQNYTKNSFSAEKESLKKQNFRIVKLTKPSNSNKPSILKQAEAQYVCGAFVLLIKLL